MTTRCCFLAVFAVLASAGCGASKPELPRKVSTSTLKLLVLHQRDMPPGYTTEDPPDIQDVYDEASPLFPANTPPGMAVKGAHAAYTRGPTTITSGAYEAPTVAAANRLFQRRLELLQVAVGPSVDPIGGPIAANQLHIGDEAVSLTGRDGNLDPASAVVWRHGFLVAAVSIDVLDARRGTSFATALARRQDEVIGAAR